MNKITITTVGNGYIIKVDPVDVWGLEKTLVASSVS